MSRELLLAVAVLFPPLALLLARQWVHLALNVALCAGTIFASEITLLAIALSVVVIAHAVWAVLRRPMPQAT
ncbi:MAG: hypothetical protein FJX54_08930 [Alphaproteobacteria bacterium]|nr:hypothetical protein [Alphaproteobacteria bacterium]